MSIRVVHLCGRGPRVTYFRFGGSRSVVVAASPGRLRCDAASRIVRVTMAGGAGMENVFDDERRAGRRVEAGGAS